MKNKIWGFLDIFLILVGTAMNRNWQPKINIKNGFAHIKCVYWDKAVVDNMGQKLFKSW